MPVEGSYRVAQEDRGTRLDVLLARVAGISRNRAQQAVTRGYVRINGLPCSRSHPVVPGEELAWRVCLPAPGRVVPRDIPLEVPYQDGHLAVIDKPAGMVMYPGPGHDDMTLANALVHLYPEIEGVGGEGRPGIVHRLDRDTSGLVAVARTQQAYREMTRMIQERALNRWYLALVTGEVPVDRARIDAPVGRSAHDRKKMAVLPRGGKEAVTTFRVLKRYPAGYTLVEAELETGRTHQVRVHFSCIGHPVAGDPDYSRGRGRRELGLGRQFLHSCRLAFTHPFDGSKIDLASDLPGDLEQALMVLERR